MPNSQIGLPAVVIGICRDKLLGDGQSRTILRGRTPKVACGFEQLAEVVVACDERVLPARIARFLGGKEGSDREVCSELLQSTGQVALRLEHAGDPVVCIGQITLTAAVCRTLGGQRSIDSKA